MSTKQKVLEIRKLSNLTQAQFASKIGVTRQTVINWEKGVTEPNAQELQGIVKLFDINEGESLVKQLAAEEVKDEKDSMDQLKETFYADLIEKNEIYALIPKAVLSDYKIVPDKIMDIIIRSNEGEKEALIAKYEVIIRGLEIKSAQLEAENKELRQITIKPK